ncbi:phage baseplate assembly protein V [Budviciaceae bacterium CWB-B4]|uniref:Phage baseplate assembly protein V n=1 Tax=Limnobaculum xujianqingii TaxID=2738837 RepID=A0A9D7AI72_9GAMM|nr:phage baseplate assembly protein V [Limnobaculum xujianqingii]MBK5073221.1 phage baseplate assembly protein V [Limnobaculum xujianqingii]MBK5176530.1 phage baseplate assembly protein V [Limnobaculum xujianqingii]
MDINDCIKQGVVVSITPRTARVEFPDSDNLPSFDLRILTPQTKTDKQQTTLAIGSQVACLMLPNGSSEGFILGSFYSDGDPEPVNSLDKSFHILTADGTVIEYDNKSQTYTINTPGQVVIKAAKTVDIDCPIVNIKGNVNIDGVLTVTNGITSKGLMTGEGNMNMTGTITTTGQITAGGGLSVQGDINATGSINGG